MLNLLEDALRQGYAVSDEELELGVRSIAIPLRDQHGSTIAAMSIVASVRRYTLDAMLETLLPQLESARRMLTSML